MGKFKEDMVNKTKKVVKRMKSEEMFEKRAYNTFCHDGKKFDQRSVARFIKDSSDDTD